MWVTMKWKHFFKLINLGFLPIHKLSTNVQNSNSLQIHYMKVCNRSTLSNFAYKVLDKHHVNPDTIRNTEDLSVSQLRKLPTKAESIYQR
jgi:hypothetical protein